MQTLFANTSSVLFPLHKFLPVRSTRITVQLHHPFSSLTYTCANSISTHRVTIQHLFSFFLPSTHTACISRKHLILRLVHTMHTTGQFFYLLCITCIASNNYAISLQLCLFTFAHLERIGLTMHVLSSQQLLNLVNTKAFILHISHSALTSSKLMSFFIRHSPWTFYNFYNDTKITTQSCYYHHHLLVSHLVQPRTMTLCILSFAL